MSQINWQPTKGDLLAFLATQNLCAIATIDDQGWPSVARVAFSENHALELMIGTAMTSRKYANLDRNPRVAIEVTDPEPRLTMQYQGRARQLAGRELREREK